MTDLDKDTRNNIVDSKESTLQRTMLNDRIRELELQVMSLKHQHVNDQIVHSELVENLHLLRKSTRNTTDKFDSVLQEHISQLKSFRFRYKAKPGGACLVNCLAVHISESEEYAMKLKKKINDHLADNLAHYKASIIYPLI